MKHNGVFLGAADPRRAAAVTVDVIEQPVMLAK
jgi:gamma-glutamyltranspeptidase / glutathione hydrolase